MSVRSQKKRLVQARKETLSTDSPCQTSPSVGLLDARPTLRQIIATRLGPREARRRLWHILPGLLPLCLWVLPHADPLKPLGQAFFSLYAVLLAVACCWWNPTFRRPGERNCVAAAVGYSGIVLFSILVFPGQVEIGVTVFAVIAFGDGFATLGGMLFRGAQLPWNRSKTWTGSLCFLLGSVPMASLYYWGEARPHVAWRTAFLCGGAAALAGVVAESLPSRINDNIRVGLAALSILVLLHFCVPGC